MPTITATEKAKRYWLLAYDAPFGIGIVVDNPQRARTQLYKARDELADPRYDTITIRTSPERPASELWMIRDRRPPPAPDIAETPADTDGEASDEVLGDPDPTFGPQEAAPCLPPSTTSP